MSYEQLKTAMLLNSTYRLWDALSDILEEPGTEIPASLRQAGVEACAALSGMKPVPLLTEQEHQQILAALNFWMEETPPMSVFKEFFQITLPLGFNEIEALCKRLEMARQEDTTGKEDSQ